MKHKIRNIFVVCMALGLFVLSASFIWVATLEIPTLDGFDSRTVTQSTKIYDRTGDVLLFDLHEDIRRTVVPLGEISRHLKNASIAIEDAEFYEHNGIRPARILKAVFDNLTEGNLLGGQGASTITQQVIKNTLLTTDKKISRKVKEWILALKIERILEKDEILELYLNE
ncbi:penicillin-binding protein, partial [Candidatus Kaiserbacteria bacterium]